MGTADHSRILIQICIFQAGKKLLVISQKQAATLNFTEHQVAELLFLSHYPLIYSKFRKCSEHQLLEITEKPNIHKP